MNVMLKPFIMLIIRHHFQHNRINLKIHCCRVHTPHSPIQSLQLMDNAHRIERQSGINQFCSLYLVIGRGSIVITPTITTTTATNMC